MPPSAEWEETLGGAGRFVDVSRKLQNSDRRAVCASTKVFSQLVSMTQFCLTLSSKELDKVGLNKGVEVLEISLMISCLKATRRSSSVALREAFNKLLEDKVTF